MTHGSSWSGITVNNTLRLSLSILAYLLSACPRSLILSFLMKATDPFQRCVPYLHLTSALFLYIDISVYRHQNLFPVDVDISGLHCISNFCLIELCYIKIIYCISMSRRGIPVIRLRRHGQVLRQLQVFWLRDDVWRGRCHRSNAGPWVSATLHLLHEEWLMAGGGSTAVWLWCRGFISGTVSTHPD